MDEYARTLLRARLRAAAAATAADRALYQALADAVEQLAEMTGDGVLTPAQGRALLNRVRSVFEEFKGRAQTAAAQGAAGTVREVVRLHKLQVERLLARAGINASVSFDRVPEIVTRMAAQIRGARDMRSLIARRIDLRLADSLDAALEQALIRGMSARDLTSQIAASLAGDDPKLLGMLSKRTANELEKAGRIAEAKRVKSILYDSRRIAVSEINNHLRLANQASLVQGHVVKAATWQLSGRHDGLPSSPDECDDLATQDKYGLGPGAHLVEYWPDAPHPFCGCTQGAPLFYHPVSTWGDVPVVDLRTR